MYILPDLKGKQIIIYLRKSRSDDPLATVDEVLQKHEQMLDEWIANTSAILDEVPEDNRFREVVSGETIESRPRFQEVLRKIESPDIKALLIKEPSRLSRGSLKEIGYIVEMLMYTGTLVLTPQGCYDLQDDRDREQFERELMRGNDYLQYQKKILKAGKLLAVKNGCYIGTYPPYGYKKVSYKEGRNTCHTLEPIPEEAEAVRRIFELYNQGIGSVKICDILDAEHVKPPRGEVWSSNTVYAVLDNIHYLGKVRWNYRPRTRKVTDGEIKRHRFTAEDHLVFDGRHPAIVDQELWDSARAKRGQITRNKRSTEIRNPLAGIIYCSCGKAVSYRQVRNKGKLIGVPRFGCGSNRCKINGSATCAEVMSEVKQVLQECIEDFEVRIEQGIDNSVELHKQNIERLEKRLQDLRDLEVKQWDEKIKGGMPDHIFQRLNAQTVADIEAITQTLCEAKDAMPVQIDLHDKLITFRAAIDILDDPDAPAKEQNDLLRKCIEKIVYSRPRIDGFMGKQGNPEPFKLEFTLRV